MNVKLLASPLYHLLHYRWHILQWFNIITEAEYSRGPEHLRACGKNSGRNTYKFRGKVSTSEYIPQESFWVGINQVWHRLQTGPGVWELLSTSIVTSFKASIIEKYSFRASDRSSGPWHAAHGALSYSLENSWNSAIATHQRRQYATCARYSTYSSLRKAPSRPWL